MLRSIGFALCALAGFASAAGSGHADEVSDFYRGKNVTIVVGYSTGGGYDLQARALSKYWSKFIPGNPNVIVQNMPGAASIVAANTVANTSPRDGTVVGIYSDSIILAPLMKVQGIQFDPRKFGWIGSLASRPTGVIFVRSDAPGPRFTGALVLTGLLSSVITPNGCVQISSLSCCRWRWRRIQIRR